MSGPISSLWSDVTGRRSLCVDLPWGVYNGLSDPRIFGPVPGLVPMSEGDNHSKMSIMKPTVQLYLTQSSQNRLAENFFRITTVHPFKNAWPTPRMPPAVWYKGRVSYTTSSEFMPKK